MNTMRWAILVWAAVLVGCESTPVEDDETSKVVHNEAEMDSPELFGDAASRLIRTTEKNVRHYFELLLQGQTQPAVAMRKSIGDTVDREFPTFQRIAVEGEFLIQRNQAVKCLGFAIRLRRRARETLIDLFDDEEVTIVSNAVLGVGILRDKETNLTPVVAMMAHGDVNVRTNAATALKELLLIKETPRELNAQYIAAIDRLISLLHEKKSVRARRAAVWALANMRHPDTLPHLIAALEDGDEMVQIGGLHGIEILGDQRALEPLLEYLDSGPTRQGASWARKGLVKIAVQGGFAKSPAELDSLSTSSREWRNWFRNARNR